MPDRLGKKPKKRLYRSRRAGLAPSALTVFITKCVLAGALLAVVWVGSRVSPVRTYLQYIFVPGASAQSPWAQWLDWQPSGDTVSPVWVMLTGRQDNLGFELPIGGEVVEAFGWTTNSLSSEPIFHEGISIASQPGSLVKSVLTGRVSALDPVLGQVTIDHGIEMLTVYSGCEEILVKLSDKVKARDDIARVGSDGTLFFALYQAGKPIDPLLKVNTGIR